VARLEYLGLLDIWAADRPLMRAWWERAKIQPGVVRAIADVVTETDLDEMTEFGGNIHDRMAERRDEYLVRFKIA
jgi:hypothetical protein